MDAFFAADRARMVASQLRARGIGDPAVLAAMGSVPRHRFVPERYRESAYGDGPLPIGHGQTISQPYIVALMVELLGLDRTCRVLEIGTGSGYQAAVLARVAGEVFTVEIVEPLARQAGALLRELGLRTVSVRHGDGFEGWPEEAPFDGIIVSAAAPSVPPPLESQLAEGGRIVIPVGSDDIQHLILGVRSGDEVTYRRREAVRFVPFTGRIGGRD